MTKDVISVKPMESHRLYLTFEDGVAGDVNVTELVSWTGVFTPLAEQAYFEQVRVDTNLGTVVWPNGADLDPDALMRLSVVKRYPTFARTGRNCRTDCPTCHLAPPHPATPDPPATPGWRRHPC